MQQTSYERDTKGKLSISLHQFLRFTQNARQTTVSIAFHSPIYLVLKTSWKEATSG